MSTDTPEDATDGELGRAELEDRITALENRLKEVETIEQDEPPNMAIIATKGTLDMAYPPLILSSTAAAFGYEVTVFHTFWGLDILHEEKSKSLKLSSIGNPNIPVPNVIGALPGMDRVMTRFMERQIEQNDTASIEELLETALDMGVELQACQMTMDLLDYDEADFYAGVTTGVGAATAIQDMAESDIQLLI